MCVPLPTPSGSMIGAKIARCPRRWARAVFRQEAVGFQPGGAQRRHISFAEIALAAPRVERVGRARPVLDAGIDEFLLKRGEEGEARLFLQRGQSAPQEIPRAAFPMLPVQRHDVGEVEALGGILAELHLDLGARVRPQHQVALGAERRLVDRAERRHHDVAVGEPDPVAQPRRQIAQRKPLAAHQAGEVANADEDQRFALHGNVLRKTHPVIASGAKQSGADLPSASDQIPSSPHPLQ
jgi:hypothetical protein